MGFLVRTFESRFHPSQEPLDRIVGLSSWTTATGVEVTPETALQSTAVFACVRVLAETVASLPLPVYRRLPNGGKERAKDYYLYPILHDLPNPEMTSFELRETMMGHLGTWGNAYAEIDLQRGRGRAKELWPLRPDKMRVRRRNGRLQYVYKLPDNVGGRTVVLPAERILHIRGFGFDGLVGYSPIHLARQAIGLSIATEEFGARFFGNNAIPGGVLEHPGELSDPAHKRLKESWEERHTGLERSHRIAILEEGMQFHDIGIPPEDSQFLETRKFQVIEIARLYRVPPHMIMDLERSTFSNIEHQSIEFVVHTIRPWLVRWEQAIRRDVQLPEERKEYFAEFLVDGLLRGDIKSRYEAYAIGRQNGWLSANDVREFENQNPINGGNVYLIPLNMIPAGQAGDMPRSRDADLEQRQRQDAQMELRSLRAATIRHRLAGAHMTIFEDAAARIVRSEIRELRKGFERFLGKRDYPQFSVWLDEFYQEHSAYIRQQMLPVLTTCAEAVSDPAAEEVGFEGDVTPELDAFIHEYVDAYVSRHTGTSIGEVRDLVREAELANEDPAPAFDQRMNDWEERRPGIIAQWESFRSNNAIAKLIYVAAGIVRLRWRAFGESCPYCSKLNGKVVGIKENFLASGVDYQPEGAERPLRPSTNIGHPPAHGGCDCMITAEA